MIKETLKEMLFLPVGGIHQCKVLSLMVVFMIYIEHQIHGLGGNWTRDDLWLVDASFVKLRQVRIGYTFDKRPIR